MILAMKLDLAKTYDKIERNFLKKLQKIGFFLHDNWHLS